MVPDGKVDRSDLIQPKIPKVVQIGKYQISLNQVKWGTFYISTGMGLLALVVIIIYTQIYIHSFPLRVDCNPDLPLNYEKCLKRGCIWVQRTNDFEPPCFFPDGYGYRYLDVKNISYGYRVSLKREPNKMMFGDEVSFVDLIVFFETDKRLRLKFVDKNMKRYEVPLAVPPPPNELPKKVDYGIEFIKKPQFGIQIKRLANNKIIFDTSVPGMIISNQFIQITTKLASSNVYGLGEHMTTEYQQSTEWKKMSFFARDEQPTTDSNLYGVHPFYMNVENDGNTHGVFFLNSNAMEFVLQPYPALTFRTIGGILDFYIFLGPTPEEVVQQYLQVIGLPFMPPYWSLGFQLSRYGYRNLEDVDNVVKRTVDNKIPYDVQYFDIDYMQDFMSFTVAEKNFKNLDAFVNKLHAKGVKVVVILNPFIASNKTLKDNYPPLDLGESRGIFIKVNGSNLEGKCWPGKVYYPDFSHPEVKTYWSQMCIEFRKLVHFDGLWIDMNEPSNFVDGSLNGCANNSLNYPPYAAGISGSGKTRKLFEKTICMDADQYAGKHYDVHNLYGFFHANVTFRTLSIIIHGSRPMVLSRSTYPGTGRFAAHWLGDNLSTWAQMRNSIPGILAFNLFGIPFVGADICGFSLNTTEELCARWMQLGAFYPFSRNHNVWDAKDQDPASFGESVMTMARDALLSRYKLLPYLYTLFHRAHTKGSTVARPLLHEFPVDKNTWNLNYQFLWGPALLISPIVIEHANSVEAYFPAGLWYNFYNGHIAKKGDGKTLVLLDEGRINLHVRGGYILPLQTPRYNTMESREQPMGLFIAPDEKAMAEGQLFWDDGISYETQEHKMYLLLNFSYKETSSKAELSSSVIVNGYPDASKLHFEYLIVGSQALPTSIELNGKVLESVMWEYNEEHQVLQLDSLNIPITEMFSLVIYH